MSFTLQSAAFADGERLPERFTLDGENHSPPLEWTGVPEGTASFLVVMEDPDAPDGVFRHWGCCNIDRGRTALPENVRESARVPEARACVNDFDRARYDGPAPPEGDGPHRYVFRIAALAVADVDGAATYRIEDVWDEARRHLLGTAELTGLYER